jgi:hypothetical protein
MPLCAALFVSAALFLPGCGAGRDVEVEGIVSTSTSASTETRAERELVLEFYDLRDGAWQFVKNANLAQPGDFREHVYAEGDQILVVAVDDGDFSGECTPGEAWGMGRASIRDNDTTAPIELDVGDHASCPPPED